MTARSDSDDPAPSHPLVTDAVLRRRLTSLARRWLGRGDEADDLVQEAYLRTAADPLPPTEAGRQAWLTTVLRHLCIDFLRRQGRYEAILAQDVAQDTALDLLDQPSPERLVAQDQQVEAALRHLTGRLAPAEAAAVLLAEVFGMEHAELGALVGRSAAASRQQLHRALARLRAEPARRHRTADDPDDDMLAMCRHALVQRDASGLIALLRAIRPAGMAGAAQGPAASAVAAAAAAVAVPQAGHRLATRTVQVHGRLALAICQGERVLCLLPLGCLTADTVLAGD